MRLAEKFGLPVFTTSSTRRVPIRASTPRNAASPRPSAQSVRDDQPEGAGDLHDHRRGGSGGALAIAVGDQLMMLVFDLLR